MRIVKVKIKDIQYTYTSYSKELYESVLRRGFAFPLQIEENDHGYRCLDGHKRLSILHDLNIQGKKDMNEVCVIITNNGNSRSNDCWRGRNHH